MSEAGLCLPPVTSLLAESYRIYLPSGLIMNQFFEVIVTEHQQSVFGLLYSLLRDREMAEDLTQEVFMILNRKIDEIDVSRPILPWLLATARNLAANARRKSAKERSLFLHGEAASSFWESFSNPALGADWDAADEASRQECEIQSSMDNFSRNFSVRPSMAAAASSIPPISPGSITSPWNSNSIGTAPAAILLSEAHSETALMTGGASSRPAAAWTSNSARARTRLGAEKDPSRAT